MSSRPWPDLGSGLAEALAGRTPTPFRHGLHEHPQLQLEPVARLAESLPPGSISAEAAEKPLVSDVPQADAAASARDVGDRIRALAERPSWFTLLNIEQDPGYRRLVDEIIDGMAEGAGLSADRLTRRMGFVFASSPNSVTSAHFDIEHSFLIQLQGRRTLSYGRFADERAREEEVHRYWNGSFGRLAELPEHDLDLQLEPGSGAYIPPYHPHWITNSGAPSLSLTVTFFDRSNEDESMVQAFNERLRRLGLRPRRYGESPARDRWKSSGMRAYGRVKRRVRRETSSSR